MTNPFAPTVPQQGPPAAPRNPFSDPYGVAPGAEHAPAVYGGPQVATAPQAAPPALDLNRLGSAPAPVVGGRGADLKAMFGRLVLMFPLAIERVPRNPKFITAEQRQRGDLEQDRLTATVVVLDDGQGGQTALSWGGDPYALPSIPHPNTDPLPYIRKGMWLNQSRLISQLKTSLPATPGAAPGMIAGRVSKAGVANTDPWYLIGATEAEVALVRQYLEAVQAGHVPHPLA